MYAADIGSWSWQVTDRIKALTFWCLIRRSFQSSRALKLRLVSRQSVNHWAVCTSINKSNWHRALFCYVKTWICHFFSCGEVVENRLNAKQINSEMKNQMKRLKKLPLQSRKHGFALELRIVSFLICENSFNYLWIFWLSISVSALIEDLFGIKADVAWGWVQNTFATGVMHHHEGWMDGHQRLFVLNFLSWFQEIVSKIIKIFGSRQRKVHFGKTFLLKYLGEKIDGG